MTATLGARPHTITEVRIVGAPNAEAVDVSLEGGAIAAITPAGEQAPAGEVLAGEGAYLSPGLWDAHVHFGQWAATFGRERCARVRQAARRGGRLQSAAAQRGRHWHELPGRAVGPGSHDEPAR